MVQHDFNCNALLSHKVLLSFKERPNFKTFFFKAYIGLKPKAAMPELGPQAMTCYIGILLASRNPLGPQPGWLNKLRENQNKLKENHIAWTLDLSVQLVSNVG